MSETDAAAPRHTEEQLVGLRSDADGWHRVDGGANHPPIGEHVEAQDGVRVVWCGVNWWLAEGWATHLVTAWRWPDILGKSNNSLTVAPDAQREAHTSGGIGSP